MHVGRARGPKLLEVLEAPSRHVVDDVQKLAGTDRERWPRFFGQVVKWRDCYIFR
jgi:hypothetical protein